MKYLITGLALFGAAFVAQTVQAKGQQKPVISSQEARTMIVFPDSVAEKARNDWMLNCQGCHQANGAGSQGGAPDMRGIVARLLAVDGGRAYLGQVPGVAYAPLDDQSLANLLNWLLQEYDPENLSNDFQPYTAQEIGSLRGMPLIEEAPEIRAELITMLKGASSTDN